MHGGAINGWVHWSTIGTRQRLRLEMVWNRCTTDFSTITRISNTYLLRVQANLIHRPHCTTKRIIILFLSLYIGIVCFIYRDKSFCFHYHPSLCMRTSLSICPSISIFYICSLTVLLLFLSQHALDKQIETTHITKSLLFRLQPRTA